MWFARCCSNSYQVKASGLRLTCHSLIRVTTHHGTGEPQLNISEVPCQPCHMHHLVSLRGICYQSLTIIILYRHWRILP